MHILFLHGLEGNPDGTKATWLKRHYNAVVPKLDTSEARTFLSHGGMDTLDAEDAAVIFKSPFAKAVGALNDEVSLVIGSSFGGALLGRLVECGLWHGPCLFLASAHVKFGTLSNFVGPSICIHGLDDSVVSAKPVRAFVKRCGAPHEFWGIEDGHALKTIRRSGLFAKAISQLI